MARSQMPAVAGEVEGLEWRKDEKDASLVSVSASILPAASRTSNSGSRRTMSARGPFSTHSWTGRTMEKTPRMRLNHSRTQLRVTWQERGSRDGEEWDDGDAGDNELCNSTGTSG